MKDAWRRLCARFDALGKRERVIVFFGAVAAVALLGYQAFIDPHLARHALAAKRLAQIAQSQQELRAKLAAGQAQSGQPDARVRADLETAARRLAQLDAQFGTLHATLVPPGRMAALVESLLKSESGLQLVSMTTLPPSPVEAGGNVAGEGSAAAGAGEAALYKHGLEITVRGSYAELLAYLDRLERLPQKMYWGSATLVAEEHPVSRLQLTVYTLSLGKSWLVI